MSSRAFCKELGTLDTVGRQAVGSLPLPSQRQYRALAAGMGGQSFAVQMESGAGIVSFPAAIWLIAWLGAMGPFCHDGTLRLVAEARLY